MTRKIIYGSLILLLVHYLLPVFVAVQTEGSGLNKPPSIYQGSRKSSHNEPAENQNSAPRQYDEFVLFSSTNQKRRRTVSEIISGSLSRQQDGSKKDEIRNESGKTSKTGVPRGLKSNSSGKEKLALQNESEDAMAELIENDSIFTGNESQALNLNKANSKTSDVSKVHLVEFNGINLQNEYKDSKFSKELHPVMEFVIKKEANANTDQSKSLSSQISEPNSKKFVASSCEAILANEKSKTLHSSPKTTPPSNFDRNSMEIQRNKAHKLPHNPLSRWKDNTRGNKGEKQQKWTCYPPEPRSAAQSIEKRKVCCCNSIDDFWSAFSAERAAFKNHTLMWDDLCTYYNATNTVICSGSQVKEVPSLKSIIEEVNTLIFDKTNIQSLEEQAATEKLPKCRGLGFTNGALFNVSREFLTQVRTSELTLSNNSLSDWNFSWFASAIPSNISVINIDMNLIQFMPNPIVGQDFVLPYLRTLIMDNNPLLMIPPNLFRPLARSPVKCLSLRNCCLEDFGKGNNASTESSLQYMPELESLDLSMNPHLTSKKIAQFLSPLRGGKLQTLQLSGNGYTNVPYSALETVSSSLKILDLHSASIFCLDNSSFPFLPKLLSLNLDFSRISSLLPGVFDSIPNLESLSLQGNRFVTVPSAVRLPTLKILNFRGNPRAEDEDEECTFSLHKDSFTGLVSLQELDLSETPMQSIATGQFYGLTALQTLYLSRCLIRTIQPRAFGALGNLDSLYLDSNLLELLDNDSFYGLHNLSTLDLQGNEITFTRPYPSPLSPLDSTDIYGHKTSTDLHSDRLYPPKENTDTEFDWSFSHSDRPFSMLKKLEVLSLASNRIGQLGPVFDDLESLRFLDLSQNVVYAWSKRVFKNNPSLTWLNLFDNQLTTVTEAMAQDFMNENLTEINIGLNPFVCSCSLYDSLEEVNPDNFVHYEEYTCTVADTFPQQHKLFSDRPEECNVKVPEEAKGPNTNIIFLTIACLVLVTSSIAVTFYVKRKRTKNRKPSDPENNIIQMKASYHYDVFICYAALDKSWVFNTLLPVFEKTFLLKVCVHERDFEPGDMIVENISSSISGSRKVLFVVSPASMMSRWCRLELDFTRISSVNEGVNKLIILQKEAVPSEDQPPILRSILNTRTYIEWDDDPQVQDLAWTKLRRVLTKPNLTTTETS